MGAMWSALTQAWQTLHVWNDLRPSQFVEGLVFVVVFVLLARLLRRWTTILLRQVDPQVSLLITRFVYLGILLLGVVGFFSIWLGSPTLVLGSFSLFALALGLALQDILKNFVAGVFLLLERPFRIGDEITVDNRTGVVQNVEIRTTTMRSMEGEEVLIPNTIVLTQTIVNRTRYPTRQFTLTAKVPSGLPLDGLTEAVRSRVEGMDEITKQPPPVVGLQPAIDGGVTLEVRYWLEYRRHDPLKVQAALGRQIYDVIQASPGKA